MEEDQNKVNFDTRIKWSGKDFGGYQLDMKVNKLDQMEGTLDFDGLQVSNLQKVKTDLMLFKDH